MEVRKIERDHFSWGVWDKKAKEFVKVFQTEEEAEECLKKMKEVKNPA